MGIKARKPPDPRGSRADTSGRRTGLTARKPPNQEMPEEPEHLGECDHSFITHSIIIEKRRVRELTQFDCCDSCAEALFESLKPDMDNSWTITVRLKRWEQLSIFDAIEALNDTEEVPA